MMKKFFVPPILPVLTVLALCLWTAWDETSNGPPRMIDGEPDDAPRFAAVFLIVLTPVLYVVFALLNLIDTCFDRLRRPFSWLASGVITAVLAVLMSKVFYVPEVDSSPVTGITMACMTAVLAIWPMCLIRRLVFSSAVGSRQ